MAEIHSIEPFPPNIDRRYFGAWLSGFTDGEGCFFLGLNSNKQTHWKRGIIHSFKISVRNDDFMSLRLIHSFFQCGLLKSDVETGGRGNKNPCAVFAVCNAEQLATIIIPHFEEFPLLAKKRHDFVIWKEGVLFAKAIKSRTTIYDRRKGGRRTKWTRTEIEHFAAIAATLRSQRSYDSSDMPPPARFPLSLDDEIGTWGSLFLD